FSLTGDLLTHLLPDTAAAAATVRQNRHAVRSVGRCVRGGGRDALHGVECSYDVATDLGRQHDDDVPPRGWPVDLVNDPLHLVETSRDGPSSCGPCGEDDRWRSSLRSSAGEQFAKFTVGPEQLRPPRGDQL